MWFVGISSVPTNGHGVHLLANASFVHVTQSCVSAFHFMHVMLSFRFYTVVCLLIRAFHGLCAGTNKRSITNVCINAPSSSLLACCGQCADCVAGLQRRKISGREMILHLLLSAVFYWQWQLQHSLQRMSLPFVTVSKIITLRHFVM